MSIGCFLGLRLLWIQDIELQMKGLDCYNWRFVDDLEHRRGRRTFYGKEDESSDTKKYDYLERSYYPELNLRELSLSDLGRRGGLFSGDQTTEQSSLVDDQHKLESSLINDMELNPSDKNGTVSKEELVHHLELLRYALDTNFLYDLDKTQRGHQDVIDRLDIQGTINSLITAGKTNQAMSLLAHATKLVLNRVSSDIRDSAKPTGFLSRFRSDKKGKEPSEFAQHYYRQGFSLLEKSLQKARESDSREAVVDITQRLLDFAESSHEIPISDPFEYRNMVKPLKDLENQFSAEYLKNPSDRYQLLMALKLMRCAESIRIDKDKVVGVVQEQNMKDLRTWMRYFENKEPPDLQTPLQILDAGLAEGLTSAVEVASAKAEQFAKEGDYDQAAKFYSLLTEHGYLRGLVGLKQIYDNAPSGTLPIQMVLQQMKEFNPTMSEEHRKNILKGAKERLYGKELDSSSLLGYFVAAKDTSSNSPERKALAQALQRVEKKGTEADRKWATAIRNLSK